MATKNDSKAAGGKPKLLTAKQAAVLDLIGEGLTTKEIADKLGSSESAVNRHVEILRSRYGHITRTQLARRYRANPGDFVAPAALAPICIDSTKQIIDLAETSSDREESLQDSPEAGLAFRDSLETMIDAPWTKPQEPQVVPRVLDGENATLTRGMAIAIMLFAIIASLVLGLAAAQALADAVT